MFTNVFIQGFEEAFDIDGDDGDAPTGTGVTNGDLSVTNSNFVDVITVLKNDTGVAFDQSDFITGTTDAPGTDFSNWGAGWTRQ